jgi:succinyl-CoA synthetase beta subunit
MNIHEYQGKEILRKYNVPVPRGIPAFSVEEALKAAESWAARCGSSRRRSTQAAAARAAA